MTLGQALLYFLTEAGSSLVRSWKVSIVAVLTIALSLYMGGLVILATQNLEAAVEGWREDFKVVVYLEQGLSEVDEGLRDLVAEPEWVRGVTEVSSEEAEERFRNTFPSLADLFAGWEEEPLPPSLEISLDAEHAETAELESWLGRLRDHPQTTMVDDDRDWVAQLGTVITVLRTVGLALGLTLLGAAIFTIASVVKLTAYLYLDEIAVMRLVGATEFFIRGPFYTEGLIQGLVGGAVALISLYVTRSVAEPPETAIWLPMLVSRFLPASQQIGLVVLGGLAGFLGAVLSLRRESLKAEADD